MKKPPPGRQGGGLGAALGAAVAAAKKTSRKAVPKKGAARKPAPKKPAPVLTGHALAAHKAHLAHLAHLQRVAQTQQGRLAHNAQLARLQRLAQLAQIAQRTPAPPAHRRRQLALGEGVACCAAEALAASLRLSGRRADDSDVLALYRRTAGDPDTGASIVATLEAAYKYGLAGVRPVFTRLEAGSESSGLRPGGAPQLASPTPWVPAARRPSYPLILGVELPGPHAVLATPDGWWSWGELHDPAEWPDAVIEEAWTLEWG